MFRSRTLTIVGAHHMAAGKHLKNVSDLKVVRKNLKAARKALAKKSRALPNKDCYATIYSVLVDAGIAIDKCLEDMDGFMKEAVADDKKNPVQGDNRAIKWVGQL